jgi:hypothetical protein
LKGNLIKRTIICLPFSAGLFSFFILTVSAQEFPLREYGVRDGLPQSQASIIYQDSRGFIWISTKNGLSRFDGTDFVNYHMKDGLPYNIVSDAFEDSEGKLWVFTSKGLSEYTGDSFVYYPPGNEFSGSGFTGPPYPGSEKTTAFFLAQKSGNTNKRIIYFDSGTYKDFSAQYASLDTFRVREMCYDSASAELFLTDESEHFYVWKDNELKKLPFKDVSNFYNDKGIFLFKSGDVILSYKGGSFSKYFAKQSAGWQNLDLINAGFEPEARYFNGEKSVIVDVPFRSSFPFVDREGTYWLSSESNLFRLISPAYRSWSTESMGMSVPWAICPDRDGNIWIGSLISDLKVFNGSAFTDRNDYKKVAGRELFFYKGSKLMSNGETWLSTNACVLIWDGKNFSRLASIPEDIQVCYIYEDPDNNIIMIGSEKGVYIIQDGKVTRDDQYVSDNLGVIEGIVRDDSGFYWMSGHNGLVKLLGSRSVKVTDPVLPDFFTYKLEKDRYGGIWVSSEEGLFYKGKDNSNFSHGLPVSVNKAANVISILDSSNLIVGRITDICVIDFDKFYKGDNDYYRIYDRTDGYPGGESLDNGIIKGKDGAVWILTSENLVRFDPSMLRRNMIPPAVHLTGLFYETDSQTWEPVKKGEFYYGISEEIKLRRDQIKIRITFTGISTPNPEKVRYQYLLKGTDSKWSLPFEKREVVFRNLQHGDYSFLLKAINADGVETKEPLILNFTIGKAFWETTLFTISVLLLVVGITVLITILLIKNKNIINEEKQKLRSELLRLQMNSFLKEFDPHFTFNALSSVGSLIMKNDRQAAYLYLTRLSSLLRTSLRDSTSLLKPVSDEMQFVRNYCELQKLRFGERFNYAIRIENNVNMSLEIPKMTIQTFVENALKHGIENRHEGGSVEIEIDHQGECHKIIVRDNGIGRSASKDINTSGTGYGIKTIRRIFVITGKNNSSQATLEFKDIKDGEKISGTEVIIIIPDLYSFRIDELTVIRDDEVNY